MIFSLIKKGVRVGFFGLGKSNLSLASRLPLDNCEIILRSDVPVDRSKLPKVLQNAVIFEGNEAESNICENVIFFSPSVKRDRPSLISAQKRGVIFSSDAELFFERSRSPLFAITGSDGKSTTATITQMLLKEAGYNAALCGNVGVPFVDADIQADYTVAELSSFMLHYYAPKSYSACVTNITPNHLDWHTDFEEYRQAKLSLLKEAERVIIPNSLMEINAPYAVIGDDYSMLKRQFSAQLFITAEGGYIRKNGEKLIDLSCVLRSEKHNVNNLMMAIAMTHELVGEDEIASVATRFDGLEHRCKRIFSKDNVDFIDSSIDSTPARTAQTLRSLGKRVVLILGGRGKGLDYSLMIPEIEKYAEAVVITGENEEDIYSDLSPYKKCVVISNFDEAVKVGIELSTGAEALLLSPASTSFDKFKNYAERGERFKKIVTNYYK